MRPAKVLLVDLENSRQQVRAKVGPIRQEMGPASGRFTVLIEPHGLDLSDRADRTWLRDKVEAVAPDLLVIGPMYRLQGDDPMDEQVAKAASRVLDHLRLAGAGCALIMEAHTPHTPAQSRKIMRPYGASLWKRWPEFGLYLDADLEDPEAWAPLKPWRGGRDERDWPTHLRRSGRGTWEPVVPRAELGATVLDKVVALVTERHPVRLSQNAIQSELHINKSAVRDAIAQGIHRGYLDRATCRSPIGLGPTPSGSQDHGPTRLMDGAP